MWIYNGVHKISWTAIPTNEEFLRRMNEDRELTITIKRKRTALLDHIKRSTKYSLLQ